MVSVAPRLRARVNRSASVSMAMIRVAGESRAAITAASATLLTPRMATEEFGRGFNSFKTVSAPVVMEQPSGPIRSASIPLGTFTTCRASATVWVAREDC